MLCSPFSSDCSRAVIMNNSCCFESTYSLKKWEHFIYLEEIITVKHLFSMSIGLKKKIIQECSSAGVKKNKTRQKNLKKKKNRPAASQNCSLLGPLTALSNILSDEEHNKTGLSKQPQHVTKKGARFSGFRLYWRLGVDFGVSGCRPWWQCSLGKDTNIEVV